MPRRAFTLIETLLTLGIAGVVLAMLFPAIQRVRESADRMRCASNPEHCKKRFRFTFTSTIG